MLGVAPWADDDWKLSERGQANDQPEKELTAYAGPDGQLTLIGLDTHARDLNVASTEPPGSYSIGGLPPTTAFTLAVWNATGDGTNSIAGTRDVERRGRRTVHRAPASSVRAYDRAGLVRLSGRGRGATRLLPGGRLFRVGRIRALRRDNGSQSTRLAA